LLCLSCLSLQGAERKLNVLMRAWADDSYIRETDAEGNPAEETCAFMKGQYHAGFYDDPASEIQFEKVAEILRDQLKARNYVMAADAAAADLLLVINWGMTEEPEEDDFEDEYDEDGNQTFGFDPNPLAESSRRLNSQLIGASNIGSLSPIHLKRQMMNEAINQERYFVNVLAFSMNELRLRQKDEPMPKPEWITVLSVPLQGTEPDLAFATMADTASVYFGRDLKNPDFIRQGAKRGTVSLGELEFIDYVEGDESTESSQ
jgi:hypothetical protein